MNEFDFLGTGEEYVWAKAMPDGWLDLRIRRCYGCGEGVDLSFQACEVDKLLEVLLKARLRQQEILDGLD